MKIVLFIILGIILAVGGFFVGVQFETSKFEYKAEEVIGKEIALLEQHKGIPTCTNAQNRPNQLNLDSNDGTLVVWSYDIASDLLKRLVIDESFTSGFEEVEKYCKQ